MHSNAFTVEAITLHEIVIRLHASVQVCRQGYPALQADMYTPFTYIQQALEKGGKPARLPPTRIYQTTVSPTFEPAAAELHLAFSHRL